MVKRSDRHPSLQRTEGKATFAWSFRRPGDIARLNSRYRFVEQYDVARRSGPAFAVASAVFRATTFGRRIYALARYDVQPGS